jgi:hypothetical protein
LERKGQLGRQQLFSEGGKSLGPGFASGFLDAPWWVW